MHAISQLHTTFKPGLALSGLGFLAGIVLVVGAAPALGAEHFERFSAAACESITPQSSTHQYRMNSNAAELQNLASSTIDTYACAVPEKGDINQYSIDNAEVYVNDQNDNNTTASATYQASAKMCSFNGSGIGGCGTTKYSTDTGYKTIKLTGTDLGEIDHYGEPYLIVTLPPKDVAASSIIGLYFHSSF